MYTQYQNLLFGIFDIIPLNIDHGEWGYIVEINGGNPEEGGQGLCPQICLEEGIISNIPLQYVDVCTKFSQTFSKWIIVIWSY